MHVQGLIEYETGGEWHGSDLPFLPVDALDMLESAASDAVTDQGVPEDGSDLLRRRYFKDGASVYGDTGPWRHAERVTWLRLDELPALARQDERWEGVLESADDLAAEYGVASVRFVLWVEE